MKINFNEKNKRVNFSDIEIGQCFIYENSLYIKVIEDSNTISRKGCRLVNGVIEDFLASTRVEAVKAEATILS